MTWIIDFHFVRQPPPSQVTSHQSLHLGRRTAHLQSALANGSIICVGLHACYTPIKCVTWCNGHNLYYLQRIIIAWGAERGGGYRGYVCSRNMVQFPIAVLRDVNHNNGHGPGVVSSSGWTSIITISSHHTPAATAEWRLVAGGREVVSFQVWMEVKGESTRQRGWAKVQ